MRERYTSVDLISIPLKAKLYIFQITYALWKNLLHWKELYVVYIYMYV